MLHVAGKKSFGVAGSGQHVAKMWHVAHGKELKSFNFQSSDLKFFRIQSFGFMLNQSIVLGI